jgi:hypothetical protein
VHLIPVVAWPNEGVIPLEHTDAGMRYDAVVASMGHRFDPQDGDERSASRLIADKWVGMRCAYPNLRDLQR